MWNSDKLIIFFIKQLITHQIEDKDITETEKCNKNILYTVNNFFFCNQ